MSKNYDLSDHAAERLDARNITEGMLDLILKNGKRKRHGGKTIVMWKNYKVVTTNDDTTIVTAYKMGTNLRMAVA